MYDRDYDFVGSACPRKSTVQSVVSLCLCLAIAALSLPGCSSTSLEEKRPDQTEIVDKPKVDLSDPLISKANLRLHVQTLTAIGNRYTWARAERGGHRLEMVRPEARDEKVAYIEAQMKAYGYQTTRQVFMERDIEGINILAVKKGSKNPDAIIELGAHFDTINGPGADDNSSGVAGVLEAARVLSQRDTELSVRFIFYDLEEIGLHGSMHHAKQLSAAIERGELEQENFRGVYNFEMIGYKTTEPDSQKSPLRIPHVFDPPTTGDFIALVGNTRSSMLVDHLKKTIDNEVPELKYFYVKRMGDVLVDAMRSDHASYWFNGPNGVMITDTANFRYDHYHKATDTPDRLDYDFMAQVVKATTHAIKTME